MGDLIDYVPSQGGEKIVNSNSLILEIQSFCLLRILTFNLYKLIQKLSENPLCVGFSQNFVHVHNSKSYTIIATVLKNLMIPMFYLRMMSPANF